MDPRSIDVGCKVFRVLNDLRRETEIEADYANRAKGRFEPC